MNVTFQFLFQSIITNYHFNWHISAFKPRFHTRTLVDRLLANMMALVRQDLQTKVTDAFVHLNARAPIARKETVGKKSIFHLVKISTSPYLSCLSMNPIVSPIQPAIRSSAPPDVWIPFCPSIHLSDQVAGCLAVHSFYPTHILLFKITSSHMCWFFSQQWYRRRHLRFALEQEMIRMVSFELPKRVTSLHSN